jgi:hypothetical protein
MTAVTMLEFANLTQPKLRGAVLNTLVKNVQLMDKIPWENTKTLTTIVPYISGIPTPSFRSLNEAPSEVKASWAQQQETLKILEVDIVVDPVLLMIDSIQNIEAANADATVKSIGYFVNWKFIHGSSLSDIEEPDGILARLRFDARHAGQTVNATSSTVKLDITPTTGVDSDRWKYLEKLDELIGIMGGVNGGESVKGLNFLCNAQLERNNWAMVRRLRAFDTTKDQFDRTFTTHRGVGFTDVGYKPASAIIGTFDSAGATSGAQIISNDADGAGSSETVISGNSANNYSNSTSLYCVRFGDDYFTGLQVAPLRVRNLGESVDNPHKSKVNLRWVFGFAAYQKRALARLVGLDVSD